MCCCQELDKCPTHQSEINFTPELCLITLLACVVLWYIFISASSDNCLGAGFPRKLTFRMSCDSLKHSFSLIRGSSGRSDGRSSETGRPTGGESGEELRPCCWLPHIHL